MKADGLMTEKRGKCNSYFLMTIAVMPRMSESFNVAIQTIDIFFYRWDFPFISKISLSFMKLVTSY